MRFLILNRHREILATDGEYYPFETVALSLPPARTFDSKQDADKHRLTLRDHTKVLPADI